MALSLEALEVIKPHIRNARIFSLGYPDLLIQGDQAKVHFNVTPTKFNDSGAWHKKGYPLPETVEFFSLLGSTFECVDITNSRGFERIADLNDKHDFGKFDLVIDAGTIEHCCNVGQALMNAANSVARGGRVFHIPPLSMFNHGFYNLCPTLLWDFYKQNGWAVEHFTVRKKSGEVSFHPTDRFSHKNHAMLDGCWMFFLARRENDNPLKWPTQTKYLNNPTLKA